MDSSQPDDEKLILDDLASDDILIAQLALESLYHQNFAGVWKFAFRFVGERHTAQDLAQEVFLAVWNRRKSLVIHGSIRAYLLSAVRFRALNVIRDQSFRGRIAKDAEIANIPIGMGAVAKAPDVMVAMDDMAERVQAALQVLSERQRTALILKWEQELTNREIAATMDIGEAAVSRLLIRAAENVRRIVLGQDLRKKI